MEISMSGYVWDLSGTDRQCADIADQVRRLPSMRPVTTSPNLRDGWTIRIRSGAYSVWLLAVLAAR